MSSTSVFFTASSSLILRIIGQVKTNGSAKFLEMIIPTWIGYLERPKCQRQCLTLTKIEEGSIGTLAT